VYGGHESGALLSVGEDILERDGYRAAMPLQAWDAPVLKHALHVTPGNEFGRVRRPNEDAVTGQRDESAADASAEQPSDEQAERGSQDRHQEGQHGVGDFRQADAIQGGDDEAEQ